jgi:hypothetical protein
MSYSSNAVPSASKLTLVRACRCVMAAGLSLLLAACPGPEPRTTNPAQSPSQPGGTTPASPPTPSKPTPPGPSKPPASAPTSSPSPPTGPSAPAAAKPDCPASYPIGVLAVLSHTVYRNTRAAINGERVCNGDNLTTDARGEGFLLLDGDRESDSIHIAANTDPRFTLTPGGCLSIENYNSGRIVLSARRRCMVVRTRDTLMLLSPGTGTQFEVTRNTVTQVVPLRGTLIKLQPLSAQQVNTFTASQLTQQAAPQTLQPQMQSLNTYTTNKLARPAVRLPPGEIRRIDNSMLLRQIQLPAPTVTVPR